MIGLQVDVLFDQSMGRGLDDEDEAEAEVVMGEVGEADAADDNQVTRHRQDAPQAWTLYRSFKNFLRSGDLDNVS